jgi:hypothetical protein
VYAEAALQRQRKYLNLNKKMANEPIPTEPQTAKRELYSAEYLGSGTFIISKPKRKSAKRRQSALKGTVRGARK